MAVFILTSTSISPIGSSFLTLNTDGLLCVGLIDGGIVLILLQLIGLSHGRFACLSDGYWTLAM